ncbi:EAP30/Vps36 family domain-containing protein [Ditylenchus destructor]|uniref:Vacuolar-sorting protein SNF8 n=1 Tax=Ditylenchus destructor TaxID=166010 RepID=A0AAD4RBH7_9BILA|nr:EAP30/Vps36 family domain-containing protein [Ditylenchus destructor]
MASRRRGIGVGAVQKKQDIQAKFQAKGDQLAGDQLEQFSQQLEVFTTKLEEFAAKHRDEIRKNSQFRRHFQEMCTTVGVDPLASSKGFWAEKLGVGDFYYELAVQIIEVCLSTSYINGGLITMDDLRNRLMRSRSKTRKEPISHDDVIRAVKKLKVLGHGFELIALGGGRFLVQSIPGELSMDDARVLQLAEEAGGYVSRELIADHLRWDEQRIERVLQRLIKEGRVWMDDQPTDHTIHYWFPALFLEQYSHFSGSGSASGSNSSVNY